MEITGVRIATDDTAASPTGPVMRLTALWALVESGLGGVLHAFHLPVTGVVVGGTAVVLITLIARFAEHPRSILRATLLVLMVKALVSPHSPLGAYVAVAFQGVAGWAIYSLTRPSLAATSFFAIIALLESALQKLLMLTLFFGAPLWEAVDTWGQWVQESIGVAAVATKLSLSEGLIAVYLGIHVLVGLFIGWMACRLPAALARERAAVEAATVAHLNVPAEGVSASASTRKRTARKWLLGGVLAAVLLYTVTITEATSPWLTAGLYLLRTLLVLVVWFAWVAPALTRAIQRWLLRRRSAYAQEMETLLSWLPVFRQQARAQYARLSQDHRGWPLYRAWLLRVVALALAVDLPPPRG